MLMNPRECTHAKVVKQKGKSYLCLLCMSRLLKVKQKSPQVVEPMPELPPNTLGINVSENIKMEDRLV